MGQTPADGTSVEERDPQQPYAVGQAFVEDDPSSADAASPVSEQPAPGQPAPEHAQLVGGRPGCGGDPPAVQPPWSVERGEDGLAVADVDRQQGHRTGTPRSLRCWSTAPGTGAEGSPPSSTMVLAASTCTTLGM